MIELFEPLKPYLPMITMGLAIWSLWNSIKNRKQSNELKMQDLALKRLEREDRFRYQHPHMYVCLDANLPVGDPPTISTSEIVVANRDERDVRVETIECGLQQWLKLACRKFKFSAYSIEYFRLFYV
ncbi:hypothetical protein [Vibrio parahaemolyticus]|uniref:hypothetical protein n=1 Tax=Vibrio parahaemolyticus TaxID=670 RepID=UPI001C58737E|nr:hypothetical protein [Vibrio parahaemolyticus]